MRFDERGHLNRCVMHDHALHERTSAGERGGSVALVDAGSVRVGWPGAPGCTTTGVAGSACCAQTGSENVPAMVLPAISQLRHVETFITDRS